MVTVNGFSSYRRNDDTSLHLNSCQQKPVGLSVDRPCRLPGRPHSPLSYLTEESSGFGSIGPRELNKKDMGARQSKKAGQNEEHIKNGTTEEAATSQGLGPNQPVNDHMQPTEDSSESKEEEDRSLALDMPAALPHGSTQVDRSVPAANLQCKEAKAQTKAKNTTSSRKYMCVPSVMNEENTEGACHLTDRFHNTIEQITATSSHAATKPTEPLVHSRQASGLPNTHVNSTVKASQKHCVNQDCVLNVLVINRCKGKSERARAKAAKKRLRQKLAKKLKAQPGGGSENSRQTTEITVAIVPESSPQVCTGRVLKHNGQQQIPQPNKADRGSTADCIQVEIKSAHPHVPVAKTPTTPSNNDDSCTITAAADTKVMLQGEPNVSQPQDDPVAVKPKKRCTNKAVNRNLPKIRTGNVITEENTNGDNERREADSATPVTAEHRVCGEGRWPQFTVNLSCSCKARCKHNPGTGLPPNVQKWIDGSNSKSN